jgi:uncharacterized delta-60 repeat protein
MTPSYRTSYLPILVSVLFILITGLVVDTQGQQIQVTAADPTAAEQGTVNLNVKVTGKGFKNGAKAKWFVTGTTDTGGVTVNSTTFVSSSEVSANITVADTAVIANFDIQVLNSDGRGGKGTELFRVTAKGGGNADCPPIQPAPTGDTSCYGTSPGCLDTTFGGVGYVSTNPGAEAFSENASGVAVQPDGKIVVAAMAKFSLNNIDFAVIRYNVDGTLDSSFGDPDIFNPLLRRGYAVTPLSTGHDVTKALVLQPDGRIVVVGYANSSYAVVVRYGTDGTLDSSFGSGGIVQLGSGAPKSDLAIQADGRILIAGPASAGGFGLVRLNTNGSLDSSFGSGGQVAVNASGARKGASNAWSLAIQRVPAVTGEERIVVDQMGQ